MNDSNRQLTAYTEAAGSGRRRNAILWQALFYLTLLLLCFSITGTIVTAMLGLYSHTAEDAITYQRQRITSQKAEQVLAARCGFLRPLRRLPRHHEFPLQDLSHRTG